MDPVSTNIELETKPHVKPMKEMVADFVAGANAGAACVLVGQPFDTVKVKMQTHSKVYSSAIGCVKHIIKHEGFKGLYAGTTPAIVANIAENSVLFLFYGQCAKVMQFITRKKEHELNPLDRACTGSLAAFFASLALCPPELVKCRLQTMRETGRGSQITAMSIVKDVLRQDGPLGFFRGLTGTLLREMPGYFFFFGGYEGTKYLLTPEGEDKDALELKKIIIAGAAGGLSIWAAIYPADLIKSKTQIMSRDQPMPRFSKIFVEILRKEGVRGLYRGITPCLIRAVPANAALFVTYEWTRHFLRL